ncbi:hypothetical protein [Kineococcus auxinigenes]
MGVLLLEEEGRRVLISSSSRSSRCANAPSVAVDGPMSVGAVEDEEDA